MFIMLSVREVTQRVPPTCIIKTARTCVGVNQRRNRRNRRRRPPVAHVGSATMVTRSTVTPAVVAMALTKCERIVAHWQVGGPASGLNAASTDNSGSNAEKEAEAEAEEERQRKRTEEENRDGKNNHNNQISQHHLPTTPTTTPQRTGGRHGFTGLRRGQCIGFGDGETTLDRRGFGELAHLCGGGSPRKLDQSIGL